MDVNQNLEAEDTSDDVQFVETPISKSTPGTSSFPDCISSIRKSSKSKNTRDNEFTEGQHIDNAGSSKKLRSDVWVYFNDPRMVDGVLKCECKHCHKSYTCTTKSGTTHLRRHVESCFNTPKYGDVGALLDKQARLLKKWKFDPNAYKDGLARAIIRHDLPFCYAEYEGIHDLNKILNPEFESVSRNTAKKYCMKVYNSEKEKLKKLLAAHPGRICLTSDVWTAVTTTSYMSVTAHFIDEKWELNNKLLSFVELDCLHSGLELSGKLLEVLKDWGIESKIFSLTLDNATSNDNLIKYLKDRLNLQNGLLCGGEFFRVRCCAHILNLIVQEGLKVAEDALKKIRKSVIYVRASDGRRREFKKCVEEVHLSDIGGGFLRQDVSTRWNSTYLMLESAIKYRRAFTCLSYNDVNYKYCPTNEEWERSEKIRAFLEPFHTMTTLISGTSYPTSNLYFVQVALIEMKLNELVDSKDDVIKDMASRMKTKFDKYWDEYCVTLAFGSVLDPNSKLKFLNFCYKILYPDSYEEKVKKVRDSLYRLFCEYDRVETASSSFSSSSSRETHSQSQLLTRTSGVSFIDLYNQQLIEEDSNDGKSELDLYLEEGLKAKTKVDILDYWKGNINRFPKLARMACDILSIPITTVASESTFSIGGRILQKYRNCLLPDTVQALICTRNWLHGFKEANSTDMQEEEEEVEEVQLSKGDSKV